VNRETISRYARLDRAAFRVDPITTAEGAPPITPEKLDDRERRIQQFRPLARILLIQARRELAKQGRQGESSNPGRPPFSR
jgi:hypothetical protein